MNKAEGSQAEGRRFLKSKVVGTSEGTSELFHGTSVHKSEVFLIAPGEPAPLHGRIANCLANTLNLQYLTFYPRVALPVP
jgi:hypothetical protein